MEVMLRVEVMTMSQVDLQQSRLNLQKSLRASRKERNILNNTEVRETVDFLQILTIHLYIIYNQ